MISRSIQKLFKIAVPGRISCRAMSILKVNKEPDLDLLDPFQVNLLEEQCIVVDEKDKVLGARSKKDCHLMSNINEGLLHRAFSVFLFNSKGELLLQQRSDSKITFPGYFTNTCCSHPLYTPEELEEENVAGVRRAAQRRLNLELGIPPEEVPLDQFQYLTRILYKAASNDVWGENEIDYILFLQKDVTLHPNPEEVKTTLYVPRDGIKVFFDTLEKDGVKITPWFSLIVNNFLFKWWDNLGDLKNFQSHKTIHHL